MAQDFLQMKGEHPFYNSIFIKLDVHIPILSWKSPTSYHWSVIITFLDSRLIELAPSSEWMWSYKPSNGARMDPNERCACPLPSSGGLRWYLH